MSERATNAAMLERCLEDLESRIDLETEDALRADWTRYVADGWPESYFAPKRGKASPPAFAWPKVLINDAIEDYDLMLLSQFAGVSQNLATGNGCLNCVRSNYGTGVLSSLFGAEAFVMDRELDTLPTTRTIGREGMERAIEAGVPDINGGLGARVFETGRRLVEVCRGYPKIGRCVNVYHPDTQGPMDICELLWGSTIFYDMVDSPELIHSALDLVTRTYIRFMEAWNEIAPPPALNTHWGFAFGGGIYLRDDSAINLSPAMFEEYVAPYNQRLLDRFGGGGIHFCGKGDHFIEKMSALRGLTSINLSQPHLNDMDRVYSATIDRGIRLDNLARGAVLSATEAGRSFRGRASVM